MLAVHRLHNGSLKPSHFYTARVLTFSARRVHSGVATSLYARLRLHRRSAGRWLLTRPDRCTLSSRTSKSLSWSEAAGVSQRVRARQVDHSWPSGVRVLLIRARVAACPASQPLMLRRALLPTTTILNNRLSTLHLTHHVARLARE